MTNVDAFRLSLDSPAVIALAAGISVALVVLALGVARHSRIAGQERQETLDKVARFSGHLPSASESATQQGVQKSRWLWFATRLVTPGQRLRIQRLLAYAGRQGSASVDQFAVASLQWAALGLLVGVLIVFWLGFTPPVVWSLVPILTVTAYLVPSARMRKAARQRSEELRLALPEALDLMNLCVGAGLGLQGAMQQVARQQQGPVAAEFTRVLQEMSLGVPRAEALLSMTKRVEQEDVRRFVYAIIQVDRLGIPLSGAMSEQAREMRARRRARAREEAQQVSVKILLPLVLCFLPGLFIIVVGPALISIWRLLAS